MAVPSSGSYAPITSLELLQMLSGELEKGDEKWKKMEEKESCGKAGKGKAINGECVKKGERKMEWKRERK